MQRRIVAVFLPVLRIELARARAHPVVPAHAPPAHAPSAHAPPAHAPPVPIALVIARPGGSVKDECSLLGNTRLDEVSHEARALGIQPGQTIAAARARCAALAVRVVPLDAVGGALGRLAEILLAFGATTSFDSESNVVWVDVTGCAHLHASTEDASGEETLLTRVSACVRDPVIFGHSCSVAMADGPRVAAALARFERKALAGHPVVAPAGHNLEVLGALPLRALPLPEAAVHWLTRLGMSTVQDLQQLPARSLRARLGAEASGVMRLLEGGDPTPLVPYIPPEIPEEKASLEYGIESSEALLFVAKSLCDTMAARLAGRVMAATRLELVLGLDRALAPAEPRSLLSLPLAAPMAERQELFAVLRSRLESYTLEAPVLSMTLRVTDMVPRLAVPLHLFEPEAKAERALPRLVAELEAELGPGKVGVLALGNRWAPEERSRLLPVVQARAQSTVVSRRAAQAALPGPDAPRGSLLSGATEPTRLLLRPVAIDVPSQGRLLVRHEVTEWWSCGQVRARDYAMAWFAPASSVAWVELSGARPSLAATLRGWVD